ncbi:hypothetical protein [Streptomyces beijiangensis]|nr:hypothetical protein [Streptomyces beijiangensis]
MADGDLVDRRDATGARLTVHGALGVINDVLRMGRFRGRPT